MYLCRIDVITIHLVVESWSLSHQCFCSQFALRSSQKHTQKCCTILYRISESIRGGFFYRVYTTENDTEKSNKTYTDSNIFIYCCVFYYQQCRKTEVDVTLRFFFQKLFAAWNHSPEEMNTCSTLFQFVLWYKFCCIFIFLVIRFYAFRFFLYAFMMFSMWSKNPISLCWVIVSVY